MIKKTLGFIVILIMLLVFSTSIFSQGVQDVSAYNAKEEKLTVRECFIIDENITLVICIGGYLERKEFKGVKNVSLYHVKEEGNSKENFIVIKESFVVIEFFTGEVKKFKIEECSEECCWIFEPITEEMIIQKEYLLANQSL